MLVNNSLGTYIYKTSLAFPPPPPRIMAIFVHGLSYPHRVSESVIAVADDHQLAGRTPHLPANQLIVRQQSMEDHKPRQKNA
jgi:hypothetical protein